MLLDKISKLSGKSLHKERLYILYITSVIVLLNVRSRVQGSFKNRN
jgi:hypothetical protein